ncbi:hypothetical protein FHR92_001048 [Fontibacillus solani]|uniref:Uncharacterized protein n=1 Tax=Fontibacillus solani TaxID=1572857 RepID=A0A7W3XQP2_9BACL|nr:hypothetical protein [Fontibacillus solani]MBA9084591.1 hypothetical protein [Fontibacillus solani]
MTDTSPRRQKKRYKYISDPELVEQIEKSGISFIEEGINEYTGEKYWKYASTNELSNIVVPYDTKKDAERYSLSRWKI